MADRRLQGPDFFTNIKNLRNRLLQKKVESSPRVTPVLQYLPLESSSHLRILHLDAGRYDDPLSGSLVHCDLNEQPRTVYNCLSYTWGSPALSHELWIDGTKTCITANLHSALRRIRQRLSSSERYPIWADGICINQNDISERNHQVALMRRIYSECQTGLIYLGEQADKSETVPAFLETLARSISLLLKRDKNPTSFDPENRYSLPQKEDPGWKALVALLNRPWFRRVWVIQEFALPPHILMLCGEWELPGCYLASIMHVQIWQYSRDAADALTEDDSIDAAAIIPLQQVHLQIRMCAGRTLGLGLDEELKKRGMPLPKRFESLIWLLDSTSVCLSTDPRDRYFAITGLASDGRDPALAPDYSKSLETVALEYGEYLVRQGYGLSLILSRESSPCKTELSSWIPDWIDHESRLHSLSVWRTTYHPNFDVQIVSAPGTGKITITGYFVDDIKRLSPPMNFEQWKSWIKDVDNLIEDVQSYPTGQAVDEALWRCIIADRSLDKMTPAPDIYGSYYKGLLDMDAYMTEIFTSELSPFNQLAAVDAVFNYNAAILRNSKFTFTGRDLFGMLPQQAEFGDSVFVLKGHEEKSTFLVRKNPNLEHYQLIGHAYIHDIWKVVELDGLEEVEITIR